jgi:hypothetical protein
LYNLGEEKLRKSAFHRVHESEILSSKIKRMRQNILYALISLLMAAGLLVAVPAFAQSTQGAGPGSWGGRGSAVAGQRAPGVFGTVTAISGSTITLSSKGFGRNASSTSAVAATYTVDASSATVMKGGATSAVSAIAVGDTLMVQGAVSGTSVTATKISDGLPKGMPQGMQGVRGMASSTRPAMASIQGNGEPVVGGSVTAISGDTLTVTNKSNVTYSVDATNATIIKMGATSTVSSIATGDNVIAQGSVNGNSVTASSVIDQGAAKTPPSSGSGSGPAPRGVAGVFGAIGGFFQHLFGFF